MTNQRRLLTFSEFFANPTMLNIDIAAIREAAREGSEQDNLRAGQDWSFLSGQVVGAENPQGNNCGR